MEDFVLKFTLDAKPLMGDPNSSIIPGVGRVPGRPLDTRGNFDAGDRPAGAIVDHRSPPGSRLRYSPAEDQRQARNRHPDDCFIPYY